MDGKPIFTFKENDEGVIPRGDVLKKLPTPQKLGGTARREQKFIFPCSIDSGMLSSRPDPDHLDLHTHRDNLEK